MAGKHSVSVYKVFNLVSARTTWFASKPDAVRAARTSNDVVVVVPLHGRGARRLEALLTRESRRA